MPVSHVSLATGAAHFARMRSFYLSALAPLGYVTYFDQANFMLGLKPAGRFPDFWLHVGKGEQTAFPAGGDVEMRPGRAHVAFDADSREGVDRWYEEAMPVAPVMESRDCAPSSLSRITLLSFLIPWAIISRLCIINLQNRGEGISALIRLDRIC
ncbi:hypothetical protein F4777DRAFT_306683 [Nemania sp. FL0916]|nr:hypothetical protein F4777DRAFT_306683 [Nemania sp. FL0916]